VRRRDLFAYLLLPGLLRADGSQSIRGRLDRATPTDIALLLKDGRRVSLDGDTATRAVLRDERLPSEDFEALGVAESPAKFRVNPIHERAMFVHRGGQRLVITYWCPVCAIRTFAPGKCMCCQEGTNLDLRDPALKDTDPTQD
jgi:hypothetical protein